MLQRDSRSRMSRQRSHVEGGRAKSLEQISLPWTNQRDVSLDRCGLMLSIPRCTRHTLFARFLHDTVDSVHTILHR